MFFSKQNGWVDSRLAVRAVGAGLVETKTRVVDTKNRVVDTKNRVVDTKRHNG